MKKRIIITVTAILISLIVIITLFHGTIFSNKATCVYVNGTIITMDPTGTLAEAVAVNRDKIIAVGSKSDVMKLTWFGTKIIDLKGATMLPGFIDSHSHFPAAGLNELVANLNSPPLGPCKSVDDIVSHLKQKADLAKKDKWILGFGYDDTLIAEKRHLTRHDLDRVSTTNPVYAMHISGHFAAVNSAALAVLGITSSTPNPQGGIIHKDSKGQPTGFLEETAKEIAHSRAIKFSLLEKIQIMRTATKEYAKKGVTTAQVAYADYQIYNGTRLFSKLGIIIQRLVVWPDFNNVGKDILEGKIIPEKESTKYFTVGAIKVIGDGSIQGYTAYLSRPYFVPFKGDRSYRGYPTYPRKELAEIVTKIYRAGRQVTIHGNGDAAIDDIIYAIDQASRAYPQKDPRALIVHCQTVREDQLDAMARLHIYPTFFSAHIYYWGDRHEKIFLGPDRASRISPAASGLKRGMPFTVHLDTPVVPMDPLLAAWCTVNRITASGKVLGPDQKVSVMNAMKSITVNAAWQVFQEKHIGSIESGKYADFVILDKNPLENGIKLKDLVILRTIVGGKTVFSK